MTLTSTDVIDAVRETDTYRDAVALADLGDAYEILDTDLEIGIIAGLLIANRDAIDAAGPEAVGVVMGATSPTEFLMNLANGRTAAQNAIEAFSG